MLAGTGSDVGKSIIATGLCRIFLQDGYNPAPFKAQNMALNSYATPDGFEIGRAQAVQAEAAGIPCHTDMNPVLLKPSGNHTSQVVLCGKPVGNRDAYDYFRRDGNNELREIVTDSFKRLSQKYNPIVMEGAGSISEINLRETDIVNMPMAKAADASVLLVADIDRGGVFASVYGSIMLQYPEDRSRIKGVIINKFRGDMRLFEQGRRMMEEICGVPVLGVVPYLSGIHIDEEDSVALQGKKHKSEEGKINIAVIKLKHISNYTDFNVLESHPLVNLYYTSSLEEIEKGDVIVVPGTKATIDDLRFIKESGIADAILSAHKKGKQIIGICGGYQILGEEVADPEGIEGVAGAVEGLGLLPVKTILAKEKATRQVEFYFLENERLCKGYEIHQGITESVCEVVHPNKTISGSCDGVMTDNGCIGTYIHGFLDNPAVIEHILKPFIKGENAGIDFDYTSFRERQYNLLADELRRYIDIDAIYKIMGRDD